MNDRARVPFALVGVVLLVGSATFAATMATRAPPREDPASERAIERATAETTAALRVAATRAATRAARNPVTSPANTTAGAVLNDSNPFRDYLRLRVYVAARDGFERVEARAGDVRATVSLPETPDASELRRAKRRVHVERAGPNGTKTRVHIENVTVTARRNGRVVERVDLSPTVVVASPVLALHDRVTRFERRLNAGPREAGLGRRLTARLYALAWTRGYAQHGGAPIRNVVANRHVELATNDAVLSTQRAVLGRVDSAGRRGLAAAGDRIALTDVLTAAGADTTRVDDILRSAERLDSGTAGGGEPIGTWHGEAPTPGDTMRVGVNRSADSTFLAFTGRGPSDRDIATGNLSAVLGSVYSARVRLAARTVRTDRTETGTLDPGGGWTRIDEHRRTDVNVDGVSVTPPSPGSGRHALRTYGRRVVRETTTVRRWRDGNETRRTRHTETTTSRVGLAVVGRHAPSEHAPRRGIATVHEPGGPLDGPNLAGVERRAVEVLVDERGGPDALARRAAAGTLDTGPVTVGAERPDGLRARVESDLVALHSRVRNVSVAVERGEVGTYEANPPAELAAELRRRRPELVDAPATYGSVAAKARVAARGAYVDAVIARLERRAARREEARAGFAGALRDRGLSLADLRQSLGAGRAGTRPPRRSRGGDGLALTVHGTPPYLPLSAVSRERIGVDGSGRVHPLTARNLNVFTTPYGDAADTVVDSLFGPDRVHLRTAAQSLAAGGRVATETDDRALARSRDELGTDVRQATGAVRASLRASLRRAGAGRSAAARREIVRAGLARWDEPAARALALTNGSAATAVAAAAARRDDRFASPRTRARLAMRLRLATERALSRARSRPAEPAVNETTTLAKRAAKKRLKAGLDRGSEAARERYLGGPLGSLPAGLPVAPTPGYWYATVNVWHVEVEGGYERFTVRSPRARPPGAPTLAYTRAGREVRLDVDADGHRERLGRGERVTFAVETPVVVVVPPGKRGVGDTDGNADERSPGWG